MFLAGLDYAIKQRLQIINLSLGTTKPQYHGRLHDLLDSAYQAGCIVVAAANNLPQPSFPSIFSSSLVSVVKDEAQTRSISAIGTVRSSKSSRPACRCELPGPAAAIAN